MAAVFTPGHAAARTSSRWLEQALDDREAQLTGADVDVPPWTREIDGPLRVPGQAVLRARTASRSRRVDVAFTVDEAVAAAEPLGYPVVVKAQVQVGGRGKAGGIKLASNADEVREHAGNILGMDIKGHVVEPALDREGERHRRGVLRARSRSTAPAKKHLGMLSAQGGVEIEEVAETDPDAIAKIHVDPVDGLTEAQCREWVAAAKLNPAATEGAVDILLKLYEAYVDGDADLVEINPLILTHRRSGARARRQGHPRRQRGVPSPRLRRSTTRPRCATSVRTAAHEKGLQYVGLDGSVGIIANGAGLAMSTVDIVSQVGGTPANFLDIGGGANADVMAGALEVINNDPKVQSIFINIFGGITKGEEVANGIVQALEPGADRRADRDPPRRHQRRRGPRDPRARTCPTSCRCSRPCSTPPAPRSRLAGGTAK